MFGSLDTGTQYCVGAGSMAVNQHAARETLARCATMHRPKTGDGRLCYGKRRAPATRAVALGYARCVCPRAIADKSAAPSMGLIEQAAERKRTEGSDLATSAFLALIGVGRGGLEVGLAPHHDPSGF